MFNTLYLNFIKFNAYYDDKHHEKILNKFNLKFNIFLDKISKKRYFLNCQNIHISIIRLVFNNPTKSIALVVSFLLEIPIKIVFRILNILKADTQYYRSIRDSIIDGIERKTGDVRENKDLKLFIRKYFFSFIFRSVSVILLLETIDKYRKLYSINTLVYEQHGGFPFGAVSAYCKKYDLYSCNGTLQIKPFNKYSLNINFYVSKGFESDRIPLPHDLKELKKLSDAKLENYLKLIKKDFLLKRDPVCNPEFIQYDNRGSKKDFKYFKNIFNNKKPNGIVLIHLLTDSARKRNEFLWFNNYLEWLYETIDNCSKNKNINWFFKSHPFEKAYPILEKQKNIIKKRIIDNGFFYIEAQEKFLQEDISQLCSVAITCHGTCKLELPALYGIPVISCIGFNELPYDSLKLPFTARNPEEYKSLILNSHKLNLSIEQIRKAKELLVFNKILSGVDINKKIEIHKHLDRDNEIVLRNN